MKLIDIILAKKQLIWYKSVLIVSQGHRLLKRSVIHAA
jgi:hypothetical protein